MALSKFRLASPLFSSLTGSIRSPPLLTRSSTFSTTAPSSDDSAADDSTNRAKYDEMLSLIGFAKKILSDMKVLVKDIPGTEILDKIREEFYWHPFQKEGNQRAYDVRVGENEMFVRVDLPGIGTKGVRVWFQDNNLYFKGEEEEDIEEDPNGGARKYSSKFYIPPGEFQTDKIDAILKNGVLRITIPKIQA